jgi:hypothetical protein
VTPTPSPTPTPTPEPVKQNKYTRKVYRDFKRDGLVDACDHTRKALRRTLKTIRPQFEEAYPDFRDAVKAAIKQHDKKKCTPPAPSPTPTPTPPPPASGGGTTPPAATPAPPPPAATPGAVPHTGGTKPAPTPSASAVPPAPTATPSPVPTPVPPSAAQQEAQVVVTRHDNGSLLVPAILLGLVALGAAGAGGSALLGARSPRFAALGHAWREAAFRAGGTWGSFTDWMRLGR